MHFHKDKQETWYVISGEFIVTALNTEDARCTDHLLQVGDSWTNYPLEPHRITCIKPGTIIEVSTKDTIEDNYRVAPGDSQNGS